MMISVIVPVYNVEPYLEKCLDSIINQTYKDIEILVIDDGSTDRSGAICDAYAEKDNRIKVFHTGNHGLSAARNLGLDHAKGEYIGFVDSDDWVEPEMYETLLIRVIEIAADVAECSSYCDYPEKSIKRTPIRQEIQSEASIEALLHGRISTQVWNKLYHRSCFKSVRFPDGRSFEDIATTHKIINHKSVACISTPFYHWIQRESGLSQSHDLKNLVDYWLAYKERYDDLYNQVGEEEKAILLKGIASAIARSWVWYWKSEKAPNFVSELSAFTRNHYSLLGTKGWPFSLRISIFLAHFNCEISYAIAYAINQLYRFMKPKYYK